MIRLLFIFCIAVSAAFTQVPATPTRLVSSLSLIDAPPPNLFTLSPKGVRVPFSVGVGSRGAANPVPASEPLRLYRETPSPDGAPGVSLAFEIPLPPGNTPLLLAFFLDSSGRAASRFLSDDPSVHTPGTVRLVNLSGSEVLCKIDEKVVPVPSQDVAGIDVKIADPLRFLFTYGARQPDGDILHVPAKRLRLPTANMRLLILFAAHYETRGENKALIVRDARVYDQVASPPPPALAQLTAVLR